MRMGREGHMQRRDFITLVGGAVAAWPLAARAQQRAFPMIGLLSSRSPAVNAPRIALIRQGLNETGFVEGQNVAIDYRRAASSLDHLVGAGEQRRRHSKAVGSVNEHSPASSRRASGRRLN